MENQYLELIQKIINSGEKKETRNSITYSLFGEKLEFDISKSIPFITTKKLAWKTVIKELLWFLSGSTDNTKLLEQNVGPDKYDNNRLEQELIYYIEKIDISEERVRLTNHCAYFKSILAEKDPNKGKKLSFVLQEMGREINTTGSKANDVDIQKAVIVMKDELEKAKEQILNVL